MRAKRILENAIDYDKFDDPYTGLAAMVFVQAAADIDSLRGRDAMYRDTLMVTRTEIVKFLRSDWADFLADAINLDRRDVIAFANAVGG